MKYWPKSFVFATLVCGVAFAAVLQFDPLKISKHLQAEMDEVMKLVMKPHLLSRYVPAEVYENMGLDPRTRLMSYHWDNCGTKKAGFLDVHNITFSPDPISFPGKFSVSFDVSFNMTITSNLSAVVLLEKKAGSTSIKIPCIGEIGSCSYDDICTLLANIQQCPPEFDEAGIPCKCPFQKGTYVLPKATFQVDASFLPSGDYHIRANLTHGSQEGGCYDIYASFS